MQRMLLEGQFFNLTIDEACIAFLVLANKKTDTNTLSTGALKELLTCLNKLDAETVRGLVIHSAYDNFVLGADVTEFPEHFKQSEEALRAWLMEVHALFARIEDAPYPTIAALKGFTLGGGLELALSCDYRVALDGSTIGFPETKLGIYPGWGGVVRLSRLIGADHAIAWIAAAENQDALTALKYGAIDAVVEGDVAVAAKEMLYAADGAFWQERRRKKRAPLELAPTELLMVFGQAKAFVKQKAGPHYPAPVRAIEAMEKGALLAREGAIVCEVEGFLEVAKSETAKSLVRVFLADQFLKKKAKAEGAKVGSLAVVGAGIMGGGIAYQAASRKLPIVMKDISEKALQLGLGEAARLLDKQVTKKKILPLQMAEVLGRIRTSLSYGDFGSVDLVIEAVVENEKVKKAVLAELEGHVREDAVLCSNTSTIAITRLAEGLKRPELFCGMHFFNPVPRMPLVEVIVGAKSSKEAIARTVAAALAMGKTPIVVQDCPGFLVNRVLFPYFAGFRSLLDDGIEYQRIDKIMEAFGWPMGPAHLLDVVGLDTALHADHIMAEAFPDRMSYEGKTPIDRLFESGRLGQKNGKGFYRYDAKGKVLDTEVAQLLKPLRHEKLQDAEIVDRMMLPMIHESLRCLEEKIVSSPLEVDMGLILGLGFPPFRGGVLRYAESIGLTELCLKSDKLAHFGKLYEPTAELRAHERAKKSFFKE